MGQNFLRDTGAVRRLVEESGVNSGDVVVELGAGSGVITRELAEQGAQVMAIESDPNWANRLRVLFRDTPNVTIVEDDLFRVSLPNGTYRVVGNIPFGATTRILKYLLDNPARGPIRTDLIVQAEVARKRAYRSNLLTMSWLPWFEFSVGMTLQPTAFRPIPAVAGGVLIISKRPEFAIAPRQRREFEKMLTLGFTGRAGRLERRLAAVIPPELFRAIARRRSWPRDVRAEHLDLDDWVALFEAASPTLTDSRSDDR